MNQLLRWLAPPLMGALILGTAGTSALAFTTVGGTSMEEPQGLSLRQESARGAGGFFILYGRHHLGGGLGGGK